MKKTFIFCRIVFVLKKKEDNFLFFLPYKFKVNFYVVQFVVVVCLFFRSCLSQRSLWETFSYFAIYLPAINSNDICHIRDKNNKNTKSIYSKCNYGLCCKVPLAVHPMIRIFYVFPSVQQP